MHFPINRWTVGIAASLLVIFGGDLLEPILKVIAIMSATHVPAV